MPCIELSLPKVDQKTKAALAAELTEAFCSTTGHSAEILGVRFFEYEADSTAVGGKLCGDSPANPYLHMVIFCPRLKRSVKQTMGAALVDAFTRASQRSSWIPVIHICEHPYDNVVVNGKLLSDAYEECAKRSFYYDLPRD
jgi:phenylpyruvate tautomerase PptA (4-oxalocrotonate tautomerase family)